MSPFENALAAEPEYSTFVALGEPGATYSTFDVGSFFKKKKRKLLTLDFPTPAAFSH